MAEPRREGPSESRPDAVRVELPPRPAQDYPVLVEPGALARLPELVRELAPAHRYALITDQTVDGLHGRALLQQLRGHGLEVLALAVAPGERHKTREQWGALTDGMLEAGLGRDSAVLALGGGVVGDLAGFVAATYLRGVPLVQLPTTLLAMIDSSVGGKTGVDTAAGKNLVGAFHQPRLVVADPRVLGTLPPPQLRAGLAEALKHGAILDADYFGWIDQQAPALLAADADALVRLVRRSVEIKAAVVARDEREGGPRKALNYGHTLGHAVEQASGYRVLHGEAVAIGMALEAELGERIGVTEPGTAARLRRALERLELPSRLPEDLDPAVVLHATRTDKKARAGQVEYALIERIGAARWGVRAPEDLVEGVLRAGAD